MRRRLLAGGEQRFLHLFRERCLGVTLQQRSQRKYHFRGKWTNACCGHPRPGEVLEDSARRRLREELGFDTPLRELFSFVYTAEDSESGLTEREFDHVLIGAFDGVPRPDPAEVSGVRWIGRDALERELAERPDDFSTWFRQAVARISALGAWPRG